MLADKAAGGWERVVLADQTDRVGVSSFFHKRHIARDVHMGRTDRDTGNRLVVGTGTASVPDMLHIVIAVADESLVDHVRRLIADGAIGGVHDRQRRFFHKLQRVHCRFSV